MSLVKKIAPLIAAGILAFSGIGFSQEAKETQKTPDLMGSIYEEVSFTRGEIADENPRFMNLLVGYNLLRKEDKNEVLLFPTFRLRVKGDKPENTWNNKGEIAAGITYMNGPFSAGIDGGYLRGLYGLEKEGAFARIWSYYWNKWDLKNLSNFEDFPIRPQTIISNDFEATTITGSFEDNLKIEQGLVLFEKDKWRVLPYVAVSLNGNTSNFAWTDYVRGTAGLRIEKDPFFLFIEGGYQQSFIGGNSGTIFFAGASAYVSVNE
jgi:hypothetical protein